jgi:hypothetical protein
VNTPNQAQTLAFIGASLISMTSVVDAQTITFTTPNNLVPGVHDVTVRQSGNQCITKLISNALPLTVT